MGHSESVADFNNKYTDKEFTDKFYKDVEEQFRKNYSNDTKKKSLLEKVDSWLDDHPVEVLSAGMLGTIYISYKLSQRLISTAIFKANKKTIDYLIKNCAVYRVEK